MFSWADPKNPSEVKDYAFDWSKDLGDDTIATASAELVSGFEAGVTIEQDDGFDGALSYVWVSGGTLTEQARIRGKIVTTGGRTFTEIGLLTVAEAVDPTIQTLDDLKADLIKLRSARISMLTGGQIKEVWRDGRRIVYNVAGVADLDRAIGLYEGLIADATAATGVTKKRFRALSVRFG